MSNLPAGVQRWLMLLLPPFAVLILCAVMVPRQNKLRKTNEEIRATQKQIQVYLKQLEDIRNLPPDPKVASLPMTRQEQSDFLRGLSALCAKTGNRIMSVTALAAPPPPDSKAQAAPSDPQKKDSNLPPGILEIKSSITFEGTFRELRSFLAGVKQSKRLVALSDIRLDMAHTGYPNLQTSLTVGRYVDAPPEYQAVTGSPADTAPKTGGT